MNQDVLSKSYTDSVNSALLEDDDLGRHDRRQSLTNMSLHSHRSDDNTVPARYLSSYTHPTPAIPIHSASIQNSLISSVDQYYGDREDRRQRQFSTDTTHLRTHDPEGMPYDGSPAGGGDEPTPLPRMQMFIISIVLFSEPLTSTILFPFIYYMLKDFHLSDDEKEIGSYAGWITSVFFLAQFCTAIFWGRISDRYGRRPVLLIGLIGNSISACLFGLSKSLWWAVGTRALCGILNGNSGVARSMISEITDSTNRAKAFSIFGFCWGIGMIGPALGGYLCKPAEHFPSLFGDNEFLKKYPYFLPCFVSSLGSLIGFVIGYFNLQESNPTVLERQQKEKRQKQDVADEQTALLGGDSHRYDDSTAPCSRFEEGMTKKQEEKSLIFQISRTSYITIAGYAIFSFHTMVFDEIMPLYFSAPPYAGGLGMSTTELAKILSIAGIQQLFYQFVLYPKLNRHFSTLVMCRFALVAFLPIYILFPELAVFKEWLATHIVGESAQLWTFRAGYMALLCVRFLGNCLAYTSFMIMVSNSAEATILGTVNGVCQSCLALVRALAPTVGGMLWSFSLRTDNTFPLDRHLVYYLISFLTVAGLFQSYYIPKRVALGGHKELLH